MNNQHTIALLVATELSVELFADGIENGISYFWEMLPRVFDVMFCLAMMTSIIAAIILLDPKVIDRTFIRIWRYLKHCLSRLKKRNKKSV